jgi:hypothetical protein
MSTGDKLLDSIGEIYDKYRYAISTDEIDALISELQAAINEYIVAGNRAGKKIDQKALDAWDKQYYDKAYSIPDDTISYIPVDDYPDTHTE